MAEEDWSAPRKESEEDLGAAGQSSRSNQATATKKIVNSKKNSKANAIQARKEASKKAMTTMTTGAALAAVVDVVDNKDATKANTARKISSNSPFAQSCRR